MKVKLWELRVKKGYTLRQLEQRSHVSRSEISNIENGLVSPRVDTLELLAQALEVSFFDLLEDVV